MAKAMPTPTTSGGVRLPGGDETYVYRWYCKCGDLLYVGVAWNLFKRIAGHYRDHAEWLASASRVEWDLYPSRAQAERVERHLISTLDPVFNTINRSLANRRVRWRDLPWPSFPEPGATPLERLHHRARALSLGDRL